jgi:hypothetical protein
MKVDMRFHSGSSDLSEIDANIEAFRHKSLLAELTACR